MACPFLPSTHAARCPRQQRAHFQRTHCTQTVTACVLLVSVRLASVSPHRDLNPRASSRGLQTYQRFYAPRVPVRLRGLGSPSQDECFRFPYFQLCLQRLLSFLVKQAQLRSPLPASFFPEQELCMRPANALLAVSCQPWARAFITELKDKR